MDDRLPTVELQPFLAADLIRLEDWLQQPHVARWWARPDEVLEWAADPPDGGSQSIVAVAKRRVGYLRWQRVGRETLDALGLHEIPSGSVDADILLGELDSLGRGVGRAALRAMVAEIRRDPSVPLIGLTSEVENTRAHRAFEAAGFRIARQYDVPRLGMCHLMTLHLDRDGETGSRSPVV